ncbi:hypothetical protein BDR03DRAFT_1071095 [Suillus americanus]|nr:hypothetical protein BDR03DRAFT_1071095 [Suillus americanus]
MSEKFVAEDLWSVALFARMFFMGYSQLPVSQYQMCQNIGRQITNAFGRGRKLIKMKRTQLYLLRHKFSHLTCSHAMDSEEQHWRFGVKDPILEVPVDTSGPSEQAAGPEFTGTALADEFGCKRGSYASGEWGFGSSKHDVANVGTWQDDVQGDVMLTYERPGMDIFKAIFASDDEESDEEKDRMDNVDEVDEPPAVSTPAKRSKPGLEIKPPPANRIVGDVDLATFKPTFIPRYGDGGESDCRSLSRVKSTDIEAEEEESRGGCQWSITDVSPHEDGQTTYSVRSIISKPLVQGIVIFALQLRKTSSKDYEGGKNSNEKEINMATSSTDNRVPCTVRTTLNAQVVYRKREVNTSGASPPGEGKLLDTKNNIDTHAANVLCRTDSFQENSRTRK